MICFIRTRQNNTVLLPVLHRQGGDQMYKPIRRGDIYYADLDPVIGSEQQGNRPVLILSNDIGNLYGPTVIVIPITSRRRERNIPTHVKIENMNGIAYNSILLCEQIRTIDKSRLQEFIGRLRINTMNSVCDSVEIALGIRHSNDFQE